MSRTLILPDDLYARLEGSARHRGLRTVEQLLAMWLANEENRDQRVRVVERIDALRQRLLAVYGEMPDSVDLLREDRER